MAKDRCRKDFTGVVFRCFTFTEFLRMEGGRQVYRAVDLFGNEFEISTAHIARAGFGSKFVLPESIDLKRQLWSIYSGMMARCHNRNSSSYYRYGARGIKVCKEWRTVAGFYRFLTWSVANGWKPGLSIDRIERTLGYEPDNCRYITRAENFVRRCNVYLTWESVAELREAWDNREVERGKFFRYWSKKLKCSIASIENAVYRRTWKN